MTKLVPVLFSLLLSQFALAAGDFTFETRLEGTFNEVSDANSSKADCVNHCLKRIAELKSTPFSPIDYRCAYRTELVRDCGGHSSVSCRYAVYCDILEMTPYSFHGPDTLTEAREPTHYLPTQSIPLKETLLPPPARGSSEDRADFDKILDFQAHRTPQECARAASEVQVSLSTFFGPAYGPLSADEAARLSAFFEKIKDDADSFVQEGKRLWSRPRPYVSDARVNPCTKRETTDAYPSGHAAISRVFAKVLAQVYPDRAPLFQARADEIASDRVLAGVHHPSDIEAGKRLGDALFAALRDNPRFQQDLRGIQKP